MGTTAGRRSHVKVFVRTRPTARPYDGFKVHKDGESVTVAFPREEASGPINNQLDSLTFKFDGVLENVDQEAAYEAAAHDAVAAALEGVNATVFCFGQTGAGKTFTMCGDAHNYAHRGIIPRALAHLFRGAAARPDRTYRVSVSHLEVYNEALFDLQAEDPAAAGETLAVTDDPTGGCTVRGLTQVEVGGEEEALAQFFAGRAARSTARHALNGASSRSHALFTVSVEMRTSEDAAERAVVSRLVLVDLAGSERTKQTGASGEAMREAASINKSLSFLEQAVAALARGDSHVPFRQSKLTWVLRDALGGNCVTTMVANVWPEAAHLESTVSTLRFAGRVRSLVTEACVNESADPCLQLRRYERQVRELKAELAMRDALSGRGPVCYDDPGEGELRELRALAEDFLAGRAALEQLPADTLRRVRETYKALRAAASSMLAAASAAAPAQSQQQASGQGTDVGTEDVGLLGEVDPAAQGGFLLGIAPANARPMAGGTCTSPRTAVPPMVARGGGGLHLSLRVAVGHPGSSGSAATGRPPAPGKLAGAGAGAAADTALEPVVILPSGGLCPPMASAACNSPGEDMLGGPLLNALFLRWKAGMAEGQSLAAAVRERGQQLRQLRGDAKDSVARVNTAKSEIDIMVQRLGGAQQATEDAAAQIDAAFGFGSSGGGGRGFQRAEIEQQLHAAKARYRAELGRLRELQASTATQSEALAAAKRAQIDAFEAWATAQGSVPASPGSTGRVAASWGGSMAEVGMAAAERGGDETGGGCDADSGGEEDPAETFERLQMARVKQADPDSGAFHAARRRMAAAGSRAPVPGRRFVRGHYASVGPSFSPIAPSPSNNA